MSFIRFVFRRSALAAFALGLVAFAGAPANATGDI
jgi:hypothetical protein